MFCRIFLYLIIILSNLFIHLYPVVKIDLLNIEVVISEMPFTYGITKNCFLLPTSLFLTGIVPLLISLCTLFHSIFFNLLLICSKINCNG